MKTIDDFIKVIVDAPYEAEKRIDIDALKLAQYKYDMTVSKLQYELSKLLMARGGRGTGRLL
jgi:hypothetical protein